jgi:hypothetical protein
MNRVVQIGSEAVSIWPEGQIFDTLEGILHFTRFTDTDLYHPRLKRIILEKEQQASGVDRYGRSGGGNKVYHFDRWDCAEATLVHERALEFFRRALKRTTAVADNYWANVSRDGDYCKPHSHHRTMASVVYFLDPGDEDPDDPEAGRFCIVDPRIAQCCGLEEGHVTTPLYADMTPGSFIMFPGAVVHAVNPYRGARPRITLAWNINETAIEGSPFDPGDDRRPR